VNIGPPPPPCAGSAPSQNPPSLTRHLSTPCSHMTIDSPLNSPLFSSGALFSSPFRRSLFLSCDHVEPLQPRLFLDFCLTVSLPLPLR